MLSLKFIVGFVLLITQVRTQQEIIERDLTGFNITNKGLHPSNNEVSVKCRLESMCVHLNKDWLKTEWGVSSLAELTMRETCDMFTEESDSEFVMCTRKRKFMSCGSEFSQNDTHAIYTNKILISYSSITGLVPELTAHIPWECTYPIEMLVGSDFAPKMSPLSVFLGNKSGLGKFEAAMFLYKDDDFKQTYDTTPQLHIHDRLRIKVQLLRGPSVSRLQVVKCWGSAVEFPQEDDLTYMLIEDYCPATDSARANVTIGNNGNLQHVLWASNVFRFAASPEVFIHCHVRVCFESGSKCEKKCSTREEVGIEDRRARRSVLDTESSLLSLGPVYIANDVPGIFEKYDEEPEDSKEEREEKLSTNEENDLILGLPKAAIFGIVGVLAAITLALIIGVSVVIHLKCRERRKTKTERYWKEQLTSKLRISKTFTLSNSPPFEIPISVPNTLSEKRSSQSTQ